MFTNYTSLIIPTRNRSSHLKNILSKLKSLKLKFKEIIVIDSSDSKYKKEVVKISKVFKIKLYNSFASTSHQRNLGLDKAKKATKYIMFLDDDIIFFKNAFINMDFRINKAEKNNEQISGFGFNNIEKTKPSFLEIIKRSKLSKYFNLYSDLPGKITNSGWHTKIQNLKKDFSTDWLYTGASIYKHEHIKNHRFILSFGSYSYLEDLDFCLNLKKERRKLIVVANARFSHPNFIARNSFDFGVTEIENRFSIVKRHNLKIYSFFIGATIRASISFLSIFVGKFELSKRFSGNIFGLIKCIIKMLKV
jgi:glycosyltransferase involved in cell wall biosynthesis